ncbi:MAG TPA: YciI family protein [Opitutaceae bacterium]
MHTQTPTPEYLLLFRGTEWDGGLSLDEMQSIMDRWNQWFEGLKEQGKIKSANPLRAEGKVIVSKKGKTTVADGPFAESKETIGGYFLLQDTSFEEALAIAQRCPAIPYGLSVEVRPVAGRCIIEDRIEEKRSAQVATPGEPAISS